MIQDNPPSPERPVNRPFYVKYVLIGVVFIVLLASNPGLDDHRAAVTAKINKLMQHEVNKDTSDTGILGEAGKQFGLMLGGVVVNKVVEQMVERKNFLLFSLTTFEYDGKEKIIGVGLLGNVFISKEIDNQFEDVKNGMNGN
jgi:hypothetical protein